MNTIVAQVDPFSLPYVGIKERRALPHESGIYFVLLGKEILYIGMANNLHQRWYAHHRYRQFKSYGDVVIAWLVVANPFHRELEVIEETYICHFNPILNGTVRPKEFVVTLPKPPRKMWDEDWGSFERRMTEWQSVTAGLNIK